MKVIEIYGWNEIATEQYIKVAEFIDGIEDDSLYLYTGKMICEIWRKPSCIKKMLYSYGIDRVLLALRFFEIQEEYEICQEIKKAIEDHSFLDDIIDVGVFLFWVMTILGTIIGLGLGLYTIIF